MPDDAWFVGLHLRSGGDITRAGRNASFKNYVSSIEMIQERGGWVIGLGQDYAENYPTLRLKNFINSAGFGLSTLDLEVLNIFVWANSKFFIGSLSGGTNVPGMFGTPILWADIHPLAHFRPPASRDRILPRRVLHLETRKYLSFSEMVSESHQYCQSENPIKLIQNGYSLVHNDPKEICDAALEMINLYSERETNRQHQQKFNELFVTAEKTYSRINLSPGAEFCKSFVLTNLDFLDASAK
jgi:putative glycosyltransferase (TIGR04372 family)